VKPLSKTPQGFLGQLNGKPAGEKCEQCPHPSAPSTEYFEAILSTLAGAVDGQRNHDLNGAAFAIGCWIEPAGLDRDDYEHRLAEVASQWPNHRKSMGTIRSGLDAGEERPHVVKPMKVTIKKAAKAAKDAAPGTGEFVGKKGFVPPRMGKHLEAEGHIRLGHDGRLYRYDAGVYVADAEKWVGKRMRELLGEYYRKRQREEVIGWLMSTMPSIASTQPADVINLDNGLLDWRRGALEPHDPKVLSTIRVPHRWNPKAKCPEISAFLNEVLPDDCIEFVLEVIGHCLIPDNRMQRSVMLIGTGGNGKGTLLNLIKMLLGPQNVAARTLHDLTEDRFARADVFGKLANICGDLDARTVERSDVFKMITGNDTLSGERKYGQPFEFVPFARLLFSANEVPPSSDQSMAYFDRWLPVPMTKRIRGTKDEVQGIIAQLTAADEMEGLLALAVEGLRRLMRRGHFKVPTSVKEEHKRFQRHVDTVLAFVEDRCVIDPEGRATRSDVYFSYQAWCAENGRRPVAAHNVYAKLMQQFPSVSPRDLTGGRGFAGIRVEATNLERSAKKVRAK
jgi:putative DNA primase/helicase